MNPIVKALATGVATAVILDVGSFISARQKDRTASFDFVLFISRCVYGVAVGTGMGAGLEAVG